jgi:cytoskeletal protein RodZ
MGKLVSYAIVLIIGILVYNNFFGSATEKQQSKEVFQKTKELGLEIRDLIKQERENYDDGKYSKIVDKVKTLIGKSDELTSKYSTKLDEIEEIQEELGAEQRKKARNSSSYDEKTEEELKRQLEELLGELSKNLE